MQEKKRTVGIWGFGQVGKSAASFFTNNNLPVVIYDDNSSLLQNSPYLVAPTIDAFLNTTEYILPSPGIDTFAYRATYNGTWLCEVDIFSHFFKKPIIAITGSVGKTSVTHTLFHIMQSAQIKAYAGGNIGTPLFEIFPLQSSIDLAIVELSSFQLEYARSFAPYLAIWTNFYPNHLDRHKTIDAYFKAKLSILLHQTINQYALVPYTLKPLIEKYQIQSNIYFFTPECIKQPSNDLLFCIDYPNKCFHFHQTMQSTSFETVANCGFLENWFICWSAMQILKKPFIPCKIPLLNHRLEKVAEINDIAFYNDSKSTTPHSTLAALKQFEKKQVILLLGGLSKGVDRIPFIKELKSYDTIRIIAFGKEAQEIKSICSSFYIEAHAFETLESAFEYATMIAIPDSIILLSPGGSSFDLFANYQERGNRFKQLVFKHKHKES